MYFDDSTEKYECPITGAHFKYEDMWDRLNKIRSEFKRSEDKESSLETLDFNKLILDNDKTQSRNINGVKESQTENKENMNQNIVKAESFYNNWYNDSFRNQLNQLPDLKSALGHKQRRVCRNITHGDMSGLQSFPTVDETFKNICFIIFFNEFLLKIYWLFLI